MFVPVLPVYPLLDRTHERVSGSPCPNGIFVGQWAEKGRQPMATWDSANGSTGRARSL